MPTLRVEGVRSEESQTGGSEGRGNGNGGSGGVQPSRSLCAQCGVYPATRPYGLCWRCYHTPGVRRAHQILSRGSRGLYPLADQVGAVAPTLLPPVPTEALPGTREKVGVLVERARLGLSLWHPQDAVRDLGVKPPGML